MRGKIYRKTTDEEKGLGYISKLVSPSGEVLGEYSHEDERIDLDLLNPYIGEYFAFYSDDKFVATYSLNSIDTNDEGQRSVSLTKIPQDMEISYATE